MPSAPPSSKSCSAQPLLANSGVSVRDPAKAAELAERGIRVRRGDFADHASLSVAFESAGRVVVTSVDSLGPQPSRGIRPPIRLQRPLASVRSITRRTKRPGDSPFAAAPEHWKTETGAAIGVPCASLRNGFYGDTVGHHVHGASETSELALPEDGPVPWTARKDLAAGAAVLVAAGIAGNDGPVFDGPTPPLTATEAITIARMMSKVTAEKIRRNIIDDQDWVQRMTGSGTPRTSRRLLLRISGSPSR